MTGLLLLAALTPMRAAAAAPTPPSFELVYSYPVETTLKEPDLRGAHEVWPKMIDAAKKTVDFEQFYIVDKAGSLLDPTMRAIERAAKRGVKVRFIMEELFFKIGPESIEPFARLKAIKGVDARAVSWKKVNGEGIIHAKYFVVDSKTVYVGSQNVDWRSLEHIHELGIKTDDAGIAKQAQAVFEHDWALSLSSTAAKPDNAERPQADRAAPAYLVASPWRLNPPGVGDAESELVRLIGEAKEELVVQNLEYDARYPYSKPLRFYAPIDNALRDAALRGVKVKLLISHWGTDALRVPDAKSLSFMPHVEIRVITIPDPASWTKHEPFTRVAHSKYMVVDGKTLWLGTSNWEGGYLDVNRNVELVIRDEALAVRAAAVQRHLWDSPYTAPLDVAKDYPAPRR